MKKIYMTTILSALLFFSFTSLTFADMSNNVSATLTVQVSPSSNSTNSIDEVTPIKGARIIVINSLGKVIGTELTDSNGTAKLQVTVTKDFRFPKKEMGEVTLITVANDYNENINFSVPINEFNDHTAKVSVSLWRVDQKKRNEPQFNNGSFHRLTVFEMLNYYAEQVGLAKQNITMYEGTTPPWGPSIKN
ncbi:hypothetical protein HPK19_05330 [Arthrobacter citreus]|nr:hypothetical protein HPK19_05330 [Arthrobacter citreus]